MTEAAKEAISLKYLSTFPGDNLMFQNRETDATLKFIPKMHINKKFQNNKFFEFYLMKLKFFEDFNSNPIIFIYSSG